MTHIIARIVAWFRPAPERYVIDQQSHVDKMEARIKRLAALDREIEREHFKVAQIVGYHARDTVTSRVRAPFSERAVGNEIALWLPGLDAMEIKYIHAASTFEIQHHLFGDDTIPGVRPVQPLEPCRLIWPASGRVPGHAVASGLPRAR